MAFIAGAYLVTVDDTAGTNLVTAGQVSNGVEIFYRWNKTGVRGDNFGETLQDAVVEGVHCFARFTLMESDEERARLLYWPYATQGSGGTLEGIPGVHGTVGRADVGSGLTNLVRLLTVAGTPAAVDASESQIDLHRAILAEDIPVRITHGTSHRSVELTLRLYPSAAGTWFTIS